MKKITFLLLSALFMADFVVAQTFSTEDYQKAAWMTLRFYGGQRSSQKSLEGPNWLIMDHDVSSSDQSSLSGKGFSASAYRKGYDFTNDADGSVDLSGGWFDCGDHVKFGQTQFYSAYIVLKGFSEWPTGYDDYYSYDYSGYHAAQDFSWEGKKGIPNGIPDVLDEVKFVCEFFIKCSPNATTFYSQVGDGNNDQKNWLTSVAKAALPNNQGGQNDGSRSVVKNPDDCAMPSFCAATLALFSKVYKKYDSEFAETCLQHAKYAFSYASAKKGKSAAAGGFYPAHKNPYDAYICAAAELFWATGDNSYKSQAISNNSNVKDHNWQFGFDNCDDIAIYNLLKLGDTSQLELLKKFINSYYKGHVNSEGVYQSTDSWGTLRYNGNVAFIMALYDTYMEENAVDNSIYANIDFIMGNNSANFSYIVGFKPRSGNYTAAQHPYHRNVYLNDNASAGQQNLNIPNRNKQFGALCGSQGYNPNTLKNASSDAQGITEVGIDLNAGLTGALAYIVSKIAPVDTSKFSVEETIEITSTTIPPISASEEEDLPELQLSEFFSTTDNELVHSVESSDPAIVYPVMRGEVLEFVQYGTGTVTITVTATAGTSTASQSFTITINPKQEVKPCELIITPEISDVSCFGGEDGKIELSVSGGVDPYQFKWSTGRTSNGIYSVSAGDYSVLVRDSVGCTTTSSFSIEEPSEISVWEDITNPTCGQDNGAISIAVSGGTAPYTQIWSKANSDAAVVIVPENLTSDVYKVIIIDDNGCRITKNYALQDGGAPTVSLVSVTPSKCNEATGSCEIAISGGVEPYSISWLDSASVWNEKKRPALLPRDYTVTVSDATNCRSAFRVEVPTIPLRPPEIALVTVGEESGKNLVVWQKPETDVIDHYTIWREGDEYGKYDKLGTVPFAETSIFADPDADIMAQSWRYKISATDACGNESPLSKEHKTIHLQKNRGLDGEVNLVWDSYEGVEYASYLIYRQTKTKVELFKKVSASLNRYTDLNPPTDVIGYYVAIQLHDTVDVNKPLKAESGPFIIAISNIAELENYADAIEEVPENQIITYAKEKNIIVNSMEQANVWVFDITGQLVAQQNIRQTTAIPVKAAGVYIVIVGDSVSKVVIY